MKVSREQMETALRENGLEGTFDINGWVWIDLNMGEVGVDCNNVSDWWLRRLDLGTPLHCALE